MGYMCVGHTATCVDVYEGQGPLGHNPKGFDVHREPPLPDCMRHDSPTPFAFSIPTLGTYSVSLRMCSISEEHQEQ